jgi:hypothetical protein
VTFKFLTFRDHVEQPPHSDIVDSEVDKGKGKHNELRKVYGIDDPISNSDEGLSGEEINAKFFLAGK